MRTSGRTARASRNIIRGQVWGANWNWYVVLEFPGANVLTRTLKSWPYGQWQGTLDHCIDTLKSADTWFQSSLTLSLLRCILTGGKVYYDGLATDSINLDALRSNITIIPQMVCFPSRAVSVRR